MQDICTNISIETSKSIKELASSIKIMKQASLVDTHIANSKDAASTLKQLKIEKMIREKATCEEIMATTMLTILLICVIKCKRRFLNLFKS